MADGTDKREPTHGKSSDEAALSARLRRLGEGLDQVAARRPVQDPAAQQRRGVDPSGLARGLRLSAELIGGVIVGAGLGWILDYALGTSPAGFIILLLLGFAAGVLNVIRSAGVYPKR